MSRKVTGQVWEVRPIGGDDEVCVLLALGEPREVRTSQRSSFMGVPALCLASARGWGAPVGEVGFWNARWFAKDPYITSVRLA